MALRSRTCCFDPRWQLTVDYWLNEQHRSIKPHEGYPGIEITDCAVGRRHLTAWNTSRAILLGYGSQVKTFGQLVLIFCTIYTKQKHIGLVVSVGVCGSLNSITAGLICVELLMNIAVGYPELVTFNLLQSVTPTWPTYEHLTWKRHWRHNAESWHYEWWYMFESMYIC
jgi:hypothetical protein